MDGEGILHRLQTEPGGHQLVRGLLGLPPAARREISAEICAVVLRRAGIADSVLTNALADIPSGVQIESRRLAVAAIVSELDEVAWDLADGDDERYPAAFRVARAAAAVAEALDAADTAVLETAYEAHHAGLELAEIVAMLEESATA